MQFFFLFYKQLGILSFPSLCDKINEILYNILYYCRRCSFLPVWNSYVHIRKGELILNNISYEKLDDILKAHNYEPSLVIAIMQDIQKEYRYLPEEALCYVAKKIGISDAKIYGVATFYENFSLEPKGKYVIKVCDGTACHVRKSVPILEEIRKQLGVSEKKPTTDDMLFTVETVSCLGACGLAPVCTVNDVVYPAMTPEKARDMIREIREKEGLA